jgi:hypothetical protein
MNLYKVIFETEIHILAENEEDAITNSQFGEWVKMTKKCILHTPADKLMDNEK